MPVPAESGEGASSSSGAANGKEAKPLSVSPVEYDYRHLKSKTTGPTLPVSKAKDFAKSYMEYDVPDDVLESCGPHSTWRVFLLFQDKSDG